MLGRTHMAVGLAVTSLIMPGIMVPVLTSLTKSLIFITTIIATTAGSWAPDLDHPNSKGSRLFLFTDTIGRVMTLLIGAGIIYGSYKMGLPSWFYWVGGFFILSAVLFFSLAKAILPMVKIERIGMIIVGLLLLLLNYKYHYNPVLNVFGLAYMIFGILKHRGLTHSLMGWALFGIGWYLLAKTYPAMSLNLPFINITYTVPLAHTIFPFVMGYGLHLAADLITNHGLLLLYPWGVRFKMPVSITTGSVLDNLIGTGASIYFMWFIFNGFTKWY